MRKNLIASLALTAVVFSMILAAPSYSEEKQTSEVKNRNIYSGDYVYKIRKKLSDGYLGPFSLSIGAGAYSGTLSQGSTDVGVEYANPAYNINLGYRKDLATFGLNILYFKPEIQFNPDVQGTQITSLNLDLGMDLYDLKDITVFVEAGLNYSTWRETLFTGTANGGLGFDLNMGVYITDYYTTGLRINRFCSNGRLLGSNWDYAVLNVAWFFGLR